MDVRPGIDVRRAGERFATKISWLDSKHSFSFGHHHDAGNTHHGLLLVNNDDVVKPGTGFETHPHQDMEIVTWVLRGALVHQDSEGHNGVIYPGLAQRMSAGTGILHSEKNDPGSRARPRTHRARALRADVGRAGRARHRARLRAAGDRGRVAARRPGHGRLGHAAARGPAAIRIKNKYAALHVARLEPGQSVELPEAPFQHLFVPRGGVTLEGAGDLAEGDAARLTATGGQRVTATEPAEVLVWEMHATIAA